MSSVSRSGRYQGGLVRQLTVDLRQHLRPRGDARTWDFAYEELAGRGRVPDNFFSERFMSQTAHKSIQLLREYDICGIVGGNAGRPMRAPSALQHANRRNGGSACAGL